MQISSLQEVIDQYIHDGQSIALEGFTHLIPFAAGHEILRQKKRDLHLIRMTPDLIYDQLIGAGCARALTFSWGGNPGVGSLHRLRDAVENDWPRPLVIHEHSHAGMAAAYTAGAARLPFGMLRGYVGTDLSGVNAQIREVRCPYTNEKIATVPAINPDVTVLHAQAADRQGNVLVRGIVGAQKEAALAATTRNSWKAWRRQHERPFVLSKFIYSGRNDDDRGRAPDSAGLCLLRRHRRAVRGRESCAPDSRTRHGANLRVWCHWHPPQCIAVVNRRWRTG